MRKITVSVVRLLNPNIRESLDDCALSERYQIQIVDIFGSDTSEYILYSRDELEPYPIPICVTYRTEYYFGRCTTKDLLYQLRDGSRVVFTFSPEFIQWYLYSVSEVEGDDVFSWEQEISGRGDIDIAALAGYTGKYTGLLAASLEVLQFNSNSTYQRFTANPTYRRLGELSLHYHGFVSSVIPIDRDKIYTGVKVFMPTLEPDVFLGFLGDWYKSFYYDRASGIKWYLDEGATAKLRVWAIQAASGLNAYF